MVWKTVSKIFRMKSALKSDTLYSFCVIGSTLRADFQSSEVLGMGNYKDDQAPYDVVSCFFALHYFMASEEAVHNLLMNVSANLKKGDGGAIYKYLDNLLFTSF